MSKPHPCPNCGMLHRFGACPSPIIVEREAECRRRERAAFVAGADFAAGMYECHAEFVQGWAEAEALRNYPEPTP